MPLQDAPGTYAVTRQTVRKLVLDVIVPVVAGRSDEVPGGARGLGAGVRLLELVLVEALLGQLVTLVLGGRSLDATHAEAEVALMVRGEDDVEIDRVTLAVRGSALASVVVDATRLVLPRLGHGVGISAETVVPGRVHGARSAGSEALLAVVAVHHDVTGWRLVQVAVPERAGRGEEEHGAHDGRRGDHVGSLVRWLVGSAETGGVWVRG